MRRRTAMDTYRRNSRGLEIATHFSIRRIARTMSAITQNATKATRTTTAGRTSGTARAMMKSSRSIRRQPHLCIPPRQRTAAFTADAIDRRRWLRNSKRP